MNETKTNGKKNFQQKGTVKNKVNNALKEQKKIELENNRKEDLAVLKEVCKALNERSEIVKDAIETATLLGISLSREARSITLGDVKNALGDKWVEPNRIGILANILIDIARCSINTKLPDYHKAIRVMYFQEKFEAYFTNHHNNDRYDLVRSFDMFVCGDIQNVFFEYANGDSEPMDLYEMGVLLIPENNNPVTGMELPIHTNNLMNTADKYINQEKEG